MSTVAMAIACALAAVLLWAALEKARNPVPTASSIQSLGMPKVAAMPITIALITAEVSVAFALAYRPDSAAAQAGMIALAAIFAVAGLQALRLDHPVRCNCFGAGGFGYLGKRQLVAFLPWTAGALMFRVAIHQPPPITSGAFRFAAIALGIAAVRSIRLLEAFREARGDRRSAQETYSWLPSY